MSQRNSKHTIISYFCAADLQQRFQLVIGNSRDTFLFILRGRKRKKRKQKWPQVRHASLNHFRRQTLKSEPRRSSQYCLLPSCFSSWRRLRCPDKYHRIWKINWQEEQHHAPGLEDEWEPVGSFYFAPWPYLTVHSLPLICRSSKYRFCFPGDGNTISEDTPLGSYIASIEKVGFLCIWHGITRVNVIILGCRTLKHFERQTTRRRLRYSYCPTDQTRHSVRRCRCQREAHLCRPSHRFPTDIHGKGSHRHVRAWLECRFVE